MNDSIIDLDAYHHEREKLLSLMDDDPSKAIEEARLLPSDMPTKGILYTSLKASVLIDAGAYVEDKRAIEAGIELFRKLLGESPNEASFHYNIGNGLVALADQKTYTGNTWYLDTAAIRCEARNHLQNFKRRFRRVTVHLFAPQLSRIWVMHYTKHTVGSKPTMPTPEL